MFALANENYFAACGGSSASGVPAPQGRDAPKRQRPKTFTTADIVRPPSQVRFVPTRDSQGCAVARHARSVVLPYRNAALQQEGTDLIDDAGALIDQPLSHPVHCLQVELIGGLGGDELHRWPLHRLGDRLGIAESFFCSFE
jgi:hypothetical protein